MPSITGEKTDNNLSKLIEALGRQGNLYRGIDDLTKKVKQDSDSQKKSFLSTNSSASAPPSRAAPRALSPVSK